MNILWMWQDLSIAPEYDQILFESDDVEILEKSKQAAIRLFPDD